MALDPRIPQSVQDELAAARARAEEREAKKAARSAEAAARLELQRHAALELADKLVAEHSGSFILLDEDDEDAIPVDTVGAVYMVPASSAVVAIKRGAGVLWNRYTASKMKSEDDERIVMSCAVHPTRDELAKLLSERPAVLPKLCLALGKLYGFKVKGDAKK